MRGITKQSQTISKKRGITKQPHVKKIMKMGGLLETALQTNVRETRFILKTFKKRISTLVRKKQARGADLTKPEKLNVCFTDKDINEALMKDRQSFYFFNLKLIIPTPVLHAKGKDDFAAMRGLHAALSTDQHLPISHSNDIKLSQIDQRFSRDPAQTGVQPNWTDLSD